VAATVVLAGGLFWWRARAADVTVYALRLPSGHVMLMEHPDHPRLQALRRREEIDRVVADAPDELGRLLALARYTSQLFPATSPFPHYPPWDGLALLDAIRAGRTGGFCAQYAHVFGQFCQSLGYAVRYVDLASKGLDSTHFVTEAYLPSLRRWVAFEPQFGHGYVDAAGAPLGALELHRRAVGARRGPVYELSPDGRRLTDRYRLFHHFRYYLRNNFLSAPVRAAVKEHPGGRQYLFEPYRLKWEDRHTLVAAESNPSLASSDPADFEFEPDFAAAVALRGRTAPELLDVIRRGPPLVVYRVRLNRRVLDDVVAGLVGEGYEEINGG
jgi:hypothetical protein